ncbi:hypothetical protein MmiEs2_02670 [Methanimicrococcus stummii]|uniref:Uncharacterized protein n=1 Tax=Methanimicrococcus stummii TaxID=3028294 RepID=A0AA96ZXT5_9EURY|nr:hypothetical protein MmiEs2_02670 [Methanimicrococcus sp. Es2]
MKNRGWFFNYFLKTEQLARGDGSGNGKVADSNGNGKVTAPTFAKRTAALKSRCLHRQDFPTGSKIREKHSKNCFFGFIEVLGRISNPHFARFAHKTRIGGTALMISINDCKPKHRFI